MRRLRPVLTAALLIALLGASDCGDVVGGLTRDTVEGRVVGSDGGRPLEGVRVTVGSSYLSTEDWLCEIVSGKPCGRSWRAYDSVVTGADGHFRLRYPTGEGRTVAFAPCRAAPPQDCPYRGRGVTVANADGAVVVLERKPGF